MDVKPTPHETGAASGKGAAWALIVDDHPLFCDALELTLRSIGCFGAIETCNHLEQALDRLSDGPAPQLVLLDLNLPDVSGLDGLVRLKRLAADAPVLIVSSMTDNAVISSALRAGAAGFVPKHSKRAMFQDAIDTIRAGRPFTPPDFVEADPDTPANDALTRLASLTNQQGRILQLICEGKLNKQIAYDLSIAETTVKAHVTAIMRKLGVQSRTQAVLVAREAQFPNALPNSV